MSALSAVERFALAQDHTHARAHATIMCQKRLAPSL